MKLIALLFFIFYSTLALSQNDYYNENHLRYDDYTYSKNIATVELIKLNAEFSLPAILLNSDEKLLLSFDDLSSNTTGYYYKLILCNHDWTPSDLMPMEYNGGLIDIFFNTNQLSFNTTISYSHYQTTIPSADMKINKSGNYLLVIYPEDKPDNPIITRRFYVYENKINIEANAEKCSNPQDYLTGQQIKLSIDPLDFTINDPYSNLFVVIQQNGRKDNIKTLSKPKSIKNGKIIYSYLNEIVFDAGNEFRRLDMRSFLIQSSNIDHIKYNSSGYQIYMLPDAVRFNQKYINYKDIDGKLSVINWDDPVLSDEIESDYGYVHLLLPVKNYNFEGSYYIMGALTNWRFDPEFKLVYNSGLNAYEVVLKLKQAYYEFNYVFLPNKNTIATTANTEGNFSETENEYHIYVYHRDQGELFERLIGIKTI